MPETAVASQLTELELLHFFLGRLISKGQKKMPIDEALKEYQLYRIELDRIRKEIQPAVDELDRGGGKELDFDELRERLERKIREAETAR